MMQIPRSPLEAVMLNASGLVPEGETIASVNGQDISSNTPEGILRRLATWLKRNDVGGPKWSGNVDLRCHGKLTVRLIPKGRMVGGISEAPAMVSQWFDVRLFRNGREFESVNLDFRTCQWEWKPPKKEKGRRLRLRLK